MNACVMEYFDVRKTGISPGLHIAGIAAWESAQIRRNAITMTAQERTNRGFRDFSGEIPQSEIDARDAIEHKPSRLAANAHAGVHLPPKRFNLFDRAIERQ